MRYSVCDSVDPFTKPVIGGTSAVLYSTLSHPRSSHNFHDALAREDLPVASVGDT